jgi:hypothetical protein
MEDPVREAVAMSRKEAEDPITHEVRCDQTARIVQDNRAQTHEGEGDKFDSVIVEDQELKQVVRLKTKVLGEVRRNSLRRLGERRPEVQETLGIEEETRRTRTERGRGRSPARQNTMQEVALVDPRVVKRQRRKVLRVGERMFNQLQFLVGNVDLREPLAKYRLQDRFFRLELQRLKVKGVKFNRKNNWREVKLVAKATNNEEFCVWFKCRYGLKGKVNRMKCSDLEFARVMSDGSAEPAPEIMAAEGNRTLGVYGTSPVSPAGYRWIRNKRSQNTVSNDHHYELQIPCLL